MTTATETQAAIAEATATKSYAWTLTAFQQHGNLWLRWSSTAPFRAQQGQIHVYDGTSFPSNPQDKTKKWTWDDAQNTPWDSGLPWGSNWYCAYIAERPPNGPYAYVVQVITPQEK
ncbi:hypothetical protein [Chromobacterium vaccinii]|uniref:Uncharacterized protein n=1 Tax=Chromobacterium vaccinii TaxID=1108595 RepID=A0A1D9LDG8_9NEIS|nr:hypothetical protein [Chromobacterium vaccinii]AOZ49290.1 hypothetical protein BKX93_04255 [Chromobacterium vaccinii]SUX53727.1 Uncharacterised protein [Chromobacterium vaccinii]